MTDTSTETYKAACSWSVGRHDGSYLTVEDEMIYELLEVFQPTVSRVVFCGRLYVDGEEVR